MPMHCRPVTRLLIRPVLLAAVCLSAALPVSVPAQEPRLYRVEMVLFRHTDPQATRSEVWQRADIAGLTDAVRLHDADQYSGFQDASRTPFALRGIVTQLEESPLYQVIASFAWEQPGLAPEVAVPLRIQAGPLLGQRAPEHVPVLDSWRIEPAMQRPPEAPEAAEALYEVDGTVTLSLARFLHLQTDLLYRRAANEPVYGDRVRTLEGRQLIETHVAERRRMRSREVHYLDHPLMGVIVEITPVE